MPISRRHQRACESSDGPPLYRIQVTNACVCTFLRVFLLRTTASSIKNVHRNLLFLPASQYWRRLRWFGHANTIRGVVCRSLSSETVDFLRKKDITKPFQLSVDVANSVLAAFVSAFCLLLSASPW